jgi:hypothetical protein
MVRTKLDERLDETLAHHRGRIFVIARTPSRVGAALITRGLRLLRPTCLPFQPNVEPYPLSLCEVATTR